MPWIENCIQLTNNEPSKTPFGTERRVYPWESSWITTSAFDFNHWCYRHILPQTIPTLRILLYAFHLLCMH